MQEQYRWTVPPDQRVKPPQRVRRTGSVKPEAREALAHPACLTPVVLEWSKHLGCATITQPTAAPLWVTPLPTTLPCVGRLLCLPLTPPRTWPQPCPLLSHHFSCLGIGTLVKTGGSPARLMLTPPPSPVTVAWTHWCDKLMGSYWCVDSTSTHTAVFIASPFLVL